MARAFARASSQDLSSTSTPVTVTPLTLAIWFYALDITTEHVLLMVYDSVGDDSFSIRARGDSGGDPIQALAYDGAALNYALSTTGYSANTWHHAVATFTSSTDRAAYIDGGSKGTNADSRTPTDIDSTRMASNSASSYMDGYLAEGGIWNVALTDAEVAVLATGVSPLAVRPQSLVAYWPLIGRTSPEIDPVGGYNMTLNNAPTTADHPAVMYPAQAFTGFAPSSAPDPHTVDISYANFDIWVPGVRIK